MKKRFVLLVCSFAVILFASACTQRVGSFSAISTKSVDWGRAESFQRGRRRSVGKDVQNTYFIISTGTPNMMGAIDRAIKSVSGGVVLVDATIYHTSWHVPFIFAQSFYTAEGTVLVDPEQTSTLP